MKKNKSYSYILPMIGSEALDIKQNGLLQNVFIADRDYPELDNHIFLLYRFKGEKFFLYFEEEVKHSPLYENSYDPDALHVMIVFRVPEEYQHDYDVFKESKFSQMSDHYKKDVVAFHNLGKTHPLVGVLYKKEFAFKLLEKKLNDGLPDRNHVHIDRNQEAASLISLEDEIYNPDLKVKKNSIQPSEEYGI